MLFITVQPNGEVTRVEVEKTEEVYPALKSAVGWIEPIDYNENLTHYHNEEFLYAEGEEFQQINYTVTVVGGILGVETPRIYGPVIFTGGIDDEGETKGLSDEYANLIETMAATVRASLDKMIAAVPPFPKPEPRVSVSFF